METPRVCVGGGWHDAWTSFVTATVGPGPARPGPAVPQVCRLRTGYGTSKYAEQAGSIWARWAIARPRLGCVPRKGDERGESKSSEGRGGARE